MIPSVDRRMDVGLLVGGGVGIPPMLYLAERMRAEGPPAGGGVCRGVPARGWCR